jgi:hypothetical protein
VVSQLMQVPFEPQLGKPGITHRLAPLQQPAGHEVPLQTQLPPEHSCPLTHWLLSPHMQPAAQRSASCGLHALHVPPPPPHCENDPTMQLVPLQHPSGHELELHTQVPPMQRCPLTHAAFMPHAHAPAIVQLSASEGSQLTHALPLMPQVPNERALQNAVPALVVQQPFGQVPELHTHAPFLQTVPLVQAALPPQVQVLLVASQPSPCAVATQLVHCTAPVLQVVAVSDAGVTH